MCPGVYSDQNLVQSDIAASNTLLAVPGPGSSSRIPANRGLHVCLTSMVIILARCKLVIDTPSLILHIDKHFI